MNLWYYYHPIRLQTAELIKFALPLHVTHSLFMFVVKIQEAKSRCLYSSSLDCDLSSTTTPEATKLRTKWWSWFRPTLYDITEKHKEHTLMPALLSYVSLFRCIFNTGDMRRHSRGLWPLIFHVSLVYKSLYFLQNYLWGNNSTNTFRAKIGHNCSLWSQRSH